MGESAPRDRSTARRVQSVIVDAIQDGDAGAFVSASTAASPRAYAAPSALAIAAPRSMSRWRGTTT